jgi:RimJ/RimL family protein N-acetyltransferase
MLVNEDTRIEGTKCILVPYTKDLVETYHAWFISDPQLLETTCSELLSIEEEYSNQESWRTDPCKLTFLIRDKTIEGSPLCGDINCFLTEYYKEDFEADSVGDSEYIPDGHVGEINLMIAVKQSRRKGIAEEALTMFMEYMKKVIPGLRVVLAKIQVSNIPSIALFEKLGFVIHKHVECFGEVHYMLRVD